MSQTEDPSVWMMLALVGNPDTKELCCSIQGQETLPATFTVDGTWAVDLAEATQQYLELVTSIYASYALFRGLHDDNIQKGAIGIVDPVE